MQARERMNFDVVIVGAGPAGLAAAIHLRQLSTAAGKDISVCVVEKGAEVGAHIISGAVIEPRGLAELFPDWKEKGAPLSTRVEHDYFYFLTKTKAFRLPTPQQMRNHGNYIASLGDLCRWLATQAEALGVQIFPGFPAANLHMENGKVCGVITGDMGLSHDGKEKPGYQPGVILEGTYTFFAEGCRGSLSEQLIKQFDLRQNASPQTYGIGIKEIWQVTSPLYKTGTVLHSIGWPLDTRTYGGSFIYHLADNKVALGYITGLDYENPYLDPFQEFQRFKTHPLVRPLLEGGQRLCYGARAINEGGLQSIPGLIFPGGALIGCSAGFLNVPKIKGSHTAIKSGMLAAEAAFDALQADAPPLLEAYPAKLKASWVYKELYKARNIRPGFHFGLIFGFIYAAIDTYVFRGHAPWTFRHKKPDHACLKPAKACEPINYPAADGKITFDKLSSVFVSNTNHEEDQPVHLTLKDATVPTRVNLPVYAAPEQRYCPAAVYEIIEKEGKPALQINAQNCVHCKTCDIKDPTQNIVWVTPEGGGGPNYIHM